ncbi:hypothetical protein [Aquimarina sp. AU119]|uniref:hypothetical protein n=1 Tax=Aquimarina sp. AU119 TaxID=2108528 RepID=UPI000D686569|nr:hypothetical protein [Aquimarina sp. AU119]
MRTILTYTLAFISSIIFASDHNFVCGGDGYWEGDSFYNLFVQTNISAKEFYPFLRDEYNNFYGENYYDEKKEIVYPRGNVNLWKEVLLDWSTKDIENVIYNFDSFNWKNKTTKAEKSAKTYIEFAQQCSEAFRYRNKRNSWDYDEILAQKTVNTEALLAKANLLLSAEANQQLKARYYYQIIRILHYSKSFSEAVNFYKTKVEDQLPKNEIYYYITDQVAGCYYSLKDYEKAAYLFTKVLNKSIDRKKSAFLSYNFCANKNAEGKPYFSGIDDEKDVLLIASLRDFSDEVNNINKFIHLDAKDPRVELLFMRALSNVERDIWPRNIGTFDRTLPNIQNNKNYKELLQIAEQQIENTQIKNKDFWKITSSYLSFINNDLTTANQKLNKVQSFPEQKKTLSIIYKVFSWDTITPENENYLIKIIEDHPTNEDWKPLILDRISHIYYKNNKIGKAFLVHNHLENVKNISSLELLNALEKFYHKPNKSKYENMLLNNKSQSSLDFISYINHQKGVYYLYQRNPEEALIYFNKEKNPAREASIPGTIFSNNIKECFSCPEKNIMADEVYKADVFSFIKTNFSKKELAINLIELKKLTHNEKQWKSKLANYLLANYYYNISNTGYYRGILTNNGNCCDYNYIDYANDRYKNTKIGANIIANRSGYTLSDVSYYDKHYFGLSDTAIEYYQKVIDLSTDKELNARCLYLMAKCELNDYYNNGSSNTFEIKLSEYQTIQLPNYNSFKILKEQYSDTEFHKMIIRECSYFKAYSSHF